MPAGKKWLLRGLAGLLAGLLFSSSGFALRPGEIVVVANRQVAAGVSLARYYCRRRRVPETNLVLLDLEAGEVCSRKAYNEKIRDPLRRFLDDRLVAGRPPVRCLLTFYGVPLKIAPPARKPGKRKQGSISGEGAGKPEDRVKKSGKRKLTVGASVDSELALVRADDYPLAGWAANPRFAGRVLSAAFRPRSELVVMVSRLDGPDPACVRRLIEDAVTAEKNGLSGRACFDARWPEPKPGKALQGYALYDAALHRAARLVEASGRLPVTIDSRGRLFSPGSCPGTALYCGWYSLARYVDAFTFKTGAVAWHIASSECESLKTKRPLWCVSLLRDGVAATLGPVAEPYVNGFPRPDLFFNCLVNRHFTLVESYFSSLPRLSWQMVLVGDPLYLPFPNH